MWSFPGGGGGAAVAIFVLCDVSGQTVFGYIIYEEMQKILEKKISHKNRPEVLRF